jgi:hypothetical protein
MPDGVMTGASLGAGAAMAGAFLAATFFFFFLAGAFAFLAGFFAAFFAGFLDFFLDFLAGAFFAFLGLAAFFAFFFFFAAMSFTPWFVFDTKTLRVFAPMRERLYRISFAMRAGLVRSVYELTIYELTMASRSISQDAPGPGGVSLR